MVTINNKKYSALIDTGASASVCSESLYNQIVRSGAKLIAMPTCGLYCITAIGHSKKKVRLQCMMPLKIGKEVIELIFLVIPNLINDLIIGCDFLCQWRASIDFERCILLIRNDMGEQITPFIEEETKEDNNNNNVNNEKQLLEETFFVENINLQNALVARIWNVSVRQHQIPLCEYAHDCEECKAKINDNYLNTCPDVNNDYINEYMRLSVIDINEANTYENIMKNKVMSNQTLNKDEKDRLYKILMKNKKVFSNKLGKCNSYIHKFQVTDVTPFNHKCRPIPSSLIDKVDETIKQMLIDGVIEKVKQYLHKSLVYCTKKG